MENSATIKHIEFWVTNLKRSMKFYKGLFSIISWKAVGKNAFSNAQTKIYFIEQDVKSKRTIGPRHICFSVNSRKIVDKVGRFLVKSKSNIIRGPLESRYKNRVSYTVDFKDPDGYIIEVATKSIVLRK